MSVATVFAEAMRADVRHTQLDARFAPLAGKVVGSRSVPLVDGKMTDRSPSTAHCDAQ
jgi:hypothetical protein